MRNYISDLYWMVRSSTFEVLNIIHCKLYEYSNERFAKADRYLRMVYRHKGLGAIYRRYTKDHQENGVKVPYGETPLRTMRRMTRCMQITSEHTILDFGSGSGRLALWLSTQIGCRVIGVEQVPELVFEARAAAKLAGIREDELTFYEGDFAKVALDNVDIIYFYGLGMADEIYERLILRLKHMQRPPWVITIGGPLSEYSHEFTTLQRLRVAFPWGWTEAYLQVLGLPSDI